MLTYILRRLLLVVPTLFGITIMVFLFMAYAPGGLGGAALRAAAGEQSAEARRIREYYEMRYALDKPALVQYGRWINSISPIGFDRYRDGDKEVIDARAAAAAKPLRADGLPQRPETRPGDLRFSKIVTKWPDFGQSLVRHRPVTTLLAEALPITLLLNLITFPIIYSIGVSTGILAAKYRGKTFDVGSGTVFLALWSIPTIWAGVMLIGFLANKQYIRLFPTGGLASTLASTWPFLPSWGPEGFQSGWLLDVVWHLILPVVCLSYTGFAVLSKLTRGSILENLHQDYVRTARAKGVGEKEVLYQHVLRNSLLPLITVASGILPAMLGGSVVIETIFGIPGMGKLMVEAVQYRDRELVLAVTFVGGLIVLLSELMRDILYAVADPRVSYE